MSETAAHVLIAEMFPPDLHNPFEDSVQSIPKTVIDSPGKLDALRSLPNCVNVRGDSFDERSAQNFVDLYSAGVGRSVLGQHGVDEQGWRENWALIELDKPCEATNEQRLDEGMLRLTAKSLGATDQLQSVFTACEVPIANGLTWIKGEATTALTIETCSGKALELFLQEIALPVEPASLTAGAFTRPTRFPQNCLYFSNLEGLPFLLAEAVGPPSLLSRQTSKA